MSKKYALNLSDDGRVLSVTFERFAKGQPLVDKLPDGDIADYLYQDGKFTLEPLPKEDEPAQESTTDELASGLAEVAEMAADNTAAVNDIYAAIAELGEMIGGDGNG